MKKRRKEAMISRAENENGELFPGDDRWAQEQGSSELSTCFEYVGRTALVLTGPYTGHRYCFRQPGARLYVDGRDRHALMAVPVLRAIAA